MVIGFQCSMKNVCTVVFAAGVIAVPHFGSAATAAVAPADKLLSEAYSLTAAGDLSAADVAYQQLIGCCPDVGYPAYSRFLSLTGQTSASDSLLQSDAGLAAQTALVRARTFISAGKKAEGIETLREPVTTATGTLYARTLLLSNQLVMLGEKQAAAEELEKVLLSPELADADRRDIFSRLMLVGDSARISDSLPQLVESMVTSSTIGYLHLRSLALDGLTALSMKPGYADFHAKLQAGAEASPAQAWLYALSCVKRGDDATALSVLEGLSTATLTPRQQAICLEELARMVALDTPRAIALYEQIIPISDDGNRIRLNLAQQHFRAKDFAKTIEILKPLDFEKLEGGDHQAALNLYLTSLGAVGPMPDLVSEFLRLSAELPYDKVRDISSAPFIFFSPDNLQGLRTAVDKTTANTSGTENAYLLLTGMENQLGNEVGIHQALEKYVMARPAEADAARELANGLAAEAWHLIENNPETSPSLELMETTANSASHALWNAIRLRPYTPEPYIKLIALYRLYNQPEKAREVPLFLSDRPNATAEEVHLAAYIYATHGYPELSIPIYERALSMQKETRFRLNYAAALGRVGRYDDAMPIYRDIIENGVNGHQYHIHEVHSSALALARRQGKEKEHLDFLHGLLNNPKVPDRDEFLLEEGKVLASAGMYQEALKFFYQYKEEFPEERVSATDIIVSTYAVMKDFATARKLLSEEIARTTDTESIAFLRNNLALTYRLEGQLDSAVAEWRKLAEDMPQEQTATRALLNAARALAQSSRIEEARRLYLEFVRLNTGDVTAEQIARDEVMRLERMEIPTDMLVQSAMLEYGPANVDHDHGPGFDLGAAKERDPAGKEVYTDNKEVAEHDDHDSDHGEMRPIRLDLGQEHDVTTNVLKSMNRKPDQ